METVARLNVSERRQLFQSAMDSSGIHREIIEKDFWVCWTLNRLFQHEWLKDRLMFKGGTSLSKAHHLISRMSEDIDLILPMELYVEEGKPVPTSPAEIRKIGSHITATNAEVVRDMVLPHLNDAIGKSCTLNQAVNDRQELLGNVEVHYPLAFGEGYIKPYVLLEMGPRSVWDPNDRFRISPYMVKELEGKFTFETPDCEVPTILPVRTFWDKVAILHSVVHRPVEKNLKPGFARHYFDVFSMAGNARFKQHAYDNVNILSSVVDYRRHVWSESWMENKYDEMIPANIRLIPAKEFQKELAEDYRAMRNMFIGEKTVFETVLEGLKKIQAEINGLTTEPQTEPGEPVV